ncbi:unnamed protein product [Caretta caretta]
MTSSRQTGSEDLQSCSTAQGSWLREEGARRHSLLGREESCCCIRIDGRHLTWEFELAARAGECSVGKGLCLGKDIRRKPSD